MPTSRSPFGVTIAPLPFPDFQTDINKQLSFWNTMQAMQNRAAGGGHALRNANGLTPWQQAQLDEKRAKAEAKAAEVEAKKNVMLGLDPVSKEPIVYRNESGQTLTQKDRDRLLADELQRRLKTAAGSDAELNKALGELNSGAQISTQRRSELQRVVRDRTKTLGREYGIDDRATFDAIIGPSQQILKEQKQALKSDSFLDTVWAGMRKGGNALYYAATMPFMSDAERLEAAKQMREEQDAITKSSPTLTERALVEQEAAREGKDVGYMQAAQANLASNIGASVADTVTSFAPAIAAGMIPVVGTYAAPFLAGGIGAGLNQVSQAARVEADPNLTEAQKQQALSYSDPGFVGTSVIGGATGAMFPGSIGSGLTRMAGRAAFNRAAAAGPINPAKVTGLTGKALRAGARATERAAAPRSLAALSRDVPVNMAENAGLMAANTVGANMAYNASVGQPVTQDAMEGVGRAAMEGAIIGMPFGVGRTLRRRSAGKTAVSTNEENASPTEKAATETQPISIFEQAMKANKSAQEWKNELIRTVRNPRKVDSAAADKLVAEYLDTVDRGAPDWRDEMTARLVSIDELPAWNKMNEKSAEALHNVVGAWKGALDDGTIAEKIASNYQRPAEGESRLASYMGELERVRAKQSAGQGSGDDSKMGADTPADSGDAASRSAEQDSANLTAAQSGELGRATPPDNGQAQAAPKTPAQQGGDTGQQTVKPADAGSTGAGSQPTGDGSRVITVTLQRRDGSKSDAAKAGGSEQSSSWTLIPEDSTNANAFTSNGKQRETLVRQSDGRRFVKINGKWRRVDDKGKKSTYTVSQVDRAEIEAVLREDAKSTNPKEESDDMRQHSFGEAPALSDKLIEKYFRTPEEKAVLAVLRDKTTDAETYQSAVRQFADIIMSRFPGMKKRDLQMLPFDSRANADYVQATGEIGLNFARVWDASDSVAAGLNYMTHELRGHAASREHTSPTVQTDLYGSAFRGASAEQKAQAIAFYGDAALAAERLGKASRGAYVGEEIYSEFYAANGSDPFITNGNIRQDMLDFFNIVPTNADKRVSAMRNVLDFLTTNADDATFREVATSAILSSKEHVDAFTGSEAKFMKLRDDAAASPSMVKMVEDYRNLTETYHVDRNKETLGIYLDELLDPETELDVFKRQSVVC